MSGPHRDRTIVLGLTGSIGMGKSTTAAMFERHGVPVHDSDAVVHALYAARGEAGSRLARSFPDAVRPDGSVDRVALRQSALADPQTLAALEAIVHPLVQAHERAFLAAHADALLVVLDIPLLFETGAEARCDSVVVVSAPASVQRERVLSRPGMTEAVFQAILAKQLPDGEKRARADFVIDTSLGLSHAEAEVAAIVAALLP